MRSRRRPVAPPNTRVQRTRPSASLRGSPLTRRPLGRPRSRRLAYSTACAFLILLVAACRDRYFVMPTTSMEPTIKKGSNIRVVPIDGTQPRRGDLVVFEIPGEAKGLQVKRVVGLPGDRVAIRSKHLIVNGKEPDEPYVTHVDPTVYETTEPSTGLARDQMPERTVGEGRLFLLGDNRDNSLDSRFFGDIALAKVVGRVPLEP
jgi:signal peptidase I